MLGYYVIDNALDNNITLQEISYQLFATYSIIWDANKYKLYYFKHIVSLIANSFTANKPLKAIYVTRALNALKTPKADKLAQKRLVDAILKLYKIIFFVMRILARAKE